MYRASMVSQAWPQRADAATYELFSKKPFWHIEEAASLVVGYAPRNEFELNYAPKNSLPCRTDQNAPPRADGGELPPPYEGALNWGALHQGRVGDIIRLYMRSIAAQGTQASKSSLYVSPRDFLKFCAEFGVDVPPELDATLAPPESKIQKFYFAAILRLAEKLAPLAAGQTALLTVEDFQQLVERAIGNESANITLRSFQTYLREFRKRPSNKTLLNSVVRTRRGRTGESERDAVTRWLPRAYSTILLPGSSKTKKAK